jgi:hypothetical protein
MVSKCAVNGCQMFEACLNEDFEHFPTFNHPQVPHSIPPLPHSNHVRIYSVFNHWRNQATAAFFPLAMASLSFAIFGLPRTKHECSTPGKC